MVQEVSSNSDYEYYLKTLAASTNGVSNVKESESEKTAQESQSAKADTVEISAQARAAMESGSVISVGSKTSSEEAETEQDAALLQSVQAAPVNTTETSTDTSSSAVDLSGYSEEQLNQMVSDGTITAAQEAAELARRAAEEELEKMQDSAGKSGTADAVKSAASQSDAVKSATATVNNISVAVTDTSDTESSSSTNLSGLTESQMDKLVSEGTISKAQESAELSRRSSEKQSQDLSQSLSKAQTNGIETYKKQAQYISATENTLNGVA